MTADPCREHREQLGALVLGRLQGAERAAVQAHVDGCEACAREVAELAPLAGLLARVDPAHVEAPPAPPARLGDLVARRIRAEGRVRTRRRRVTGLALAGAAAAAAIAAFAASSLLDESSESGPPTQRVAFPSSRPGVDVSAAIAPRAWGSQLTLSVRGVRPGTLCRVWLRGPDGRRVSAGSFRYRYEGGSDDAVLTAGLSPSEIEAIAVRAGPERLVAPLDDSAAPNDT
jgi:hypothetical protein